MSSCVSAQEVGVVVRGGP